MPWNRTEYAGQVDELMTKCTLTCMNVEGHEKPAQDEMYERHADVKITTPVPHQVLRPEFFKDLIKVGIIVRFP